MNTEDHRLIPVSEVAGSDPPTVRCIAYATRRTHSINYQDAPYEIVD